MGRVFLLGSGFSKAAGAPLAREVLAQIFLTAKIKPDIHDLKIWLEQHLFENRPGWLQQADFEEVISRLELFEKYTDAPLHNRQTLEFKLNLLLKEFIRLLHPNKLQNNLSYYDHFVQNLRPGDIIITFNYDLIIEEALIRNNYAVNYQLDLLDSPFDKLEKSSQQENILPKKQIPVLKLHGSINLAFCPDCLAIQTVSAELFLCIHCNKETSSSLRPFIIPPTLFKSYALPKQRQLWYSAYQYLCHADELIIIGYSLPAADILAVQLLDFAYRANGMLQPVTVINGNNELNHLQSLYQHNLTNTKQKFLEWCSSLT